VNEEDDEWYEPEPWGWKGNTITAVALVASAVALHFTGWWQPKPPTQFIVKQWQPMKNSLQYCHVARFYYNGRVWVCA